jgi:1-acyl-sn-glycerol-3-phosphate acyltransferase
MMPFNTSSPLSRLRLYLGSTLLFITMMTTALLIGPLVLLCYFFPFSVRYHLAKLWVALILWTAKVCCGLTYQVEGLAHIQGISAAVVLCKHQSAFETIALRLILPTQTALLKQSLLKIPVWGWALATLKPIAIDRSKQRQSLKILLKEGKACLQQGIWVVVFPEGTRTAPGETKKFNAGGAMLAEKTGYPVIPIAHNAGLFWARNSFLKYPGTIKVKIGAAIATQGRKATDINAEAAAWIEQAMQEL